ncbi:SMP-30/gluconolactonase/LRE family protein [Pelagicoccus mobilis]|nr:hypothetical protein [Pelagicoccus mobilis]
MIQKPAPAAIAALTLLWTTLTFASSLGLGETEILHVFETSDGLIPSPEGIAFDDNGNAYLSLRIFDGRQHLENRLLKLSSAGKLSRLANFGPAPPGAKGILGLATDHENNLYAAFASGDKNHGVWKVNRNGEKQRLYGSEKINVPNALTFDQLGNLYVTDSFPKAGEGPGLVWRYTRGSNRFQIWASSPLLAPDPINNPLSPPPPAPPVEAPGVNGIVFVPPNSIYVANTEKSLILRIEVGPNGNAGPVQILAGSYPPLGPPGQLFSPDGLTADQEGNLYTVNPPCGWTGIPQSAVVKINATTGQISGLTPVLTEPPNDFDFPTSLAFSARNQDRKHLFVIGIGGAVYGLPGSGAKLTKVGLGAPGSPKQ